MLTLSTHTHTHFVSSLRSPLLLVFSALSLSLSRSFFPQQHKELQHALGQTQQQLNAEQRQHEQCRSQVAEVRPCARTPLLLYACLRTCVGG